MWQKKGDEWVTLFERREGIEKKNGERGWKRQMDWRNVFRKSNNVVGGENKKGTVEEKIEDEGKMSVRWETEGLQTVGIVCLVIMFLKLMHLLGLIDITETGEPTWERGSEEEEEEDDMKRGGWSGTF